LCCANESQSQTFGTASACQALRQRQSANVGGGYTHITQLLNFDNKMKRQYFLLLLLVNLIFCSFNQPSTVVKANGADSLHKVLSDSSDIKARIEKYAESINNADTGLASGLFAHSEEVSFIHPMGHEHGWTEINNHIYKFFSEFFSKRKLNITNEHITVYCDTAWAEFYWVFDATFKKDNSPLQTKGIETQIWRKVKKEWRLVHVHYSNMPANG
jgi:ketosteroid isomerase-like protein